MWNMMKIEGRAVPASPFIINSQCSDPEYEQSRIRYQGPVYTMKFDVPRGQLSPRRDGSVVS